MTLAVGRKSLPDDWMELAARCSQRVLCPLLLDAINIGDQEHEEALVIVAGVRVFRFSLGFLWVPRARIELATP